MIHLEIRRMTLMLYSWCYIWNSRTHRAETSNKSQKQSTLYLKKGVLIRCGKFTGEYPYRGVISIKLQSNFIKAWLKQLSKVSVWGYSWEICSGNFLEIIIKASMMEFIFIIIPCSHQTFIFEHVKYENYSLRGLFFEIQTTFRLQRLHCKTF